MMRLFCLKKILVLTGIFLFFILSPCAARGKTHHPKAAFQDFPAAPWPEEMPDYSDPPPKNGDPGPLPESDLPGPAPPPEDGSHSLTALPRNDSSRAEEVMKALAAAYPGRVGTAEYRNGDWAVPVREFRFDGKTVPAETWFYYAGGRILPEELRERAGEYDPQPFYYYPAELPPWEAPGPEEDARLRAMARGRQSNPPKRSQHFFDALWRAGSRNEAWDRVKSMRFLGRPVLVHYMILEELALVEERILTEAKTKPRIQQWINGLGTLDGWNWRNIADTRSRSFHAYGAALDLLPRSPGGKESYWLWAARRTPEWWTVSYDKRVHPPEEVIQAFECQGFIWGGKWLFFDTMHFEYRPEILILNRLPVSDELQAD
ncbi:MAG: M15 family metallopeptidase [Treponema sp.]|nr:M15 family metallopeptidase [Treponema sp.]